jgi:hypothetical protein
VPDSSDHSTQAARILPDAKLHQEFYPSTITPAPELLSCTGGIAAKLPIIPAHSRHHKSLAWAPRALADRAAIRCEPAGAARIDTPCARATCPACVCAPGVTVHDFAGALLTPRSPIYRAIDLLTVGELATPAHLPSFVREGCGMRPTSAHWAQPLRQHGSCAVCAGLTSGCSDRRDAGAFRRSLTQQIDGGLRHFPCA